MYGLSGPQGTYPCLWCVVHRQAMSTPSPETQQRTLETIIADNDAYRRDNRDKKEAAKYNNCLHTPILQIQLDKVVPPYLHILLGIVLKHHKHLEDAAHTIDKKITEQLDVHLTELGKTVKQYGAKWWQAQELQYRLEYEQGCLVFSERAEDIEMYKKQVESTEHTLPLLQDTELTPRSGPVASSLDTILTKYRITPQAYHSRSFIGNHCHKYTTPDVYEALTQTIVSQTQACTDNTMVLDEAFTIKFQFDDINRTFSQVHKAISHTDPIQEQSIPAIQTLINNYMTTYRRLYPGKTIPKQHILESHCIPHISHYKFGLGLLGEQGTESAHQTITYLEKFRASGIVNREQKLRHILSSHLLNILSRLCT
ncbi:amine oxidase [Plakobranchus ocellatus]|uniref:Amine oxidase n=1 Tax=Plakobranchus ocellatus TaxID=259542 RepID=A0AAV4AYC8_9GAST|nr:amine oxidase [Plakobranchus ocellatus]